LNLYFAEYVTDEGLAAIKWNNWQRLTCKARKSATRPSSYRRHRLVGVRECGVRHGNDVGLERLTSLPNLKSWTIGEM